jgi:hypothetical protein
MRVPEAQRDIPIGASETGHGSIDVVVADGNEVAFMLVFLKLTSRPTRPPRLVEAESPATQLFLSVTAECVTMSKRLSE